MVMLEPLQWPLVRKRTSQALWARAFPVHADPARPPLAQGLSSSSTISATHLTLRAAPAQSPFTDSSGKEGRLTTTPSKKKSSGFVKGVIGNGTRKKLFLGSVNPDNNVLYQFCLMCTDGN